MMGDPSSPTGSTTVTGSSTGIKGSSLWPEADVEQRVKVGVRVRPFTFLEKRMGVMDMSKVNQAAGEYNRRHVCKGDFIG